MNRPTLMFVLASTLAASAQATCPSADAIQLANDADKIIAVNPDEAIRELEQATKLDTTNARILYKLARAYVHKEEDWEKAAQAASRAAQLAPDFATYHALAGNALMHQQAWADAKAQLEEAVRIDPLLSDAHVDLAMTLEHLHDEQGALEHYVKAIRAAPSKPDAYEALADLYYRLAFFDRAEAVVREALTWSPTGHAHFELAIEAGALAEQRHAMPEAIARYEEAKVACGPCAGRDERVIYYYLGAALALSKPPRKAEAMANLLSFQKAICKGALAQRYADQCMEANELMKRLGGP